LEKCAASATRGAALQANLCAIGGAECAHAALCASCERLSLPYQAASYLNEKGV